jgi:hypothetical protein
MSIKDIGKSTSGISQYVRTAEKLLAAGRYRIALDALSVAQEFDPHNSSLPNIIERALVLEANSAVNDAAKQEGSNGNGRRPYLSVTVGKHFESGVKDEETPLTAEEVHTRVKMLVDAANVFLGRGLNESAFESLMRAYLLDPLAPEVISGEKSILPVLEVMGDGPGGKISTRTSSEDRTTESNSASLKEAPLKRGSLLRRWMQGR